MTTPAKRKKKTDPRVEPLSKLLCQQWDDDWGLGWRWHRGCAREILALLDGMKK
jgi:hypothetical protein